MNSSGQNKQVEAWSSKKFNAFINDRHPDDYQLIDVRQRYEYGESHLPSAICFPVDDLPQQIETLAPHKPTLIYCNQGALSQAAAAVLVRGGFKHVYYLSDGFQSWPHGISSGSPEETCSTLLDLDSPVKQAELAWHMEESARSFYLEMSRTIEESGIAALFAELVDAEDQHKSTLKALWEALAGHPWQSEFSSFSEKKIMEGGLSLEEALTIAKESSPAQIVDYAMAMELNAYDQYLYLQRNSKDPDSQRLFEVMADEERHHLKALATSLEKLNRST